MRKFCLAVIVALGFASIAALAQTPAGSTGTCKDGTYTSSTSKRGACAGHGGLQKLDDRRSAGSGVETSRKQLCLVDLSYTSSSTKGCRRIEASYIARSSIIFS